MIELIDIVTHLALGMAGYQVHDVIAHREARQDLLCPTCLGPTNEIGNCDYDELRYHCEECDDRADHAVPRAPGMGNEYYCSDCCPRCNLPYEKTA